MTSYPSLITYRVSRGGDAVDKQALVWVSVLALVLGVVWAVGGHLSAVGSLVVIGLPLVLLVFSARS